MAELHEKRQLVLIESIDKLRAEAKAFRVQAEDYLEVVRQSNSVANQEYFKEHAMDFLKQGMAKATEASHLSNALGKQY